MNKTAIVAPVEAVGSTHGKGTGPVKHTSTFVVDDEFGLHARPAAELAQVAKAFQADIVFFANGISANARSILSLLLLGATQGMEVRVTADGADAADALLALRQTRCLSELEPQTWATGPRSSRTGNS